MKILSWDVGIINLAYCILEKDKWKIHKWNKINILDEEQKKCQYENCTNNATGTKKDNFGNEYFFCTKHKKFYKNEDDNEDITIDKFQLLEEDKNKEKITCNKCKIKAKYS